MIIKLRPMQQELYDLMVDGHNLLIQQSRQVGITEVMKEFIIDTMITNPGKRILIIGESLNKSYTFLDKIRKDIPTKIIGIENNAKNNIVLHNRSSVSVTNCSDLENKLCSKQYDSVFVDNLDFVSLSYDNFLKLRTLQKKVQFVFSCNDVKRNIISLNIVKANLGITETFNDVNINLVFKDFLWYKALWYSNPDFTYDRYNEMKSRLGEDQFNKEITLLK